VKHKLRLFAIHQIDTSLWQTDSLNPRIKWYMALDESNRMKFAFFTMHLGKDLPPQNHCRLQSVFFFYTKKHRFTSSTFPIQPDFSQNLPAAITLNTGSPRTLVRRTLSVSQINSHEESFGRMNWTVDVTTHNQRSRSDRSLSKSNRLHVDIIRVLVHYRGEAYSIDSFK